MKLPGIKRILPLILTILLIPGMLAVPARADEITESGWMNLMDYGFLRGFDSHTGYLYDSGTYYYDLPSYYMTYGIRMVFSSTSPVDSVNFNYNGYIFPAVLEEIGDRLYVASVDVTSGISSIGFSFDFTQGSSSVSILDISVNFVGQAYSENLLVNGKAWCGDQTCSFSSTVVNGLSAVAPDVDCEILLVPMDWKEYDFLTIYFEHEAFTISSISADLSLVPIPYEVDYLAESNVNNEFRYSITLDLRGLSRSGDYYPNIRIQCRIQNNDVTTFQILNAVGYVLVDPAPVNTYWYSKILDFISTGFVNVGGWISDQTSSLVSWLSSVYNSIGSGFSNVSTWISNQTSSITNSISTWGQNIVNAINPPADTDDMRNEVENIRDQMQDANDVMNELQRPDIDDVFHEVQLDIGTGSPFADIMSGLFANDFIVTIVTGSLAFTLFGILVG